MIKAENKTAQTESASPILEITEKNHQGEAMPRISFSEVGDTPFERLLGHNPAIQEHWRKLETAFLDSPRLPSELKEAVRRVLAHRNGCEYCMAKGRPADSHPDIKQSLAVTLAERIAQDYRDLDNAQFEVLRRHFRDDELAELCAYICFTTAAQMFGAVLRLRPEAPTPELPLPRQDRVPDLSTWVSGGIE